MKKTELLTPEEFEAITSLAGELVAAKLKEAKANQARVTLEAKLAALIPGKEEGQRTINLANKSKVVVERGLIYKANAGDIEAIEALDVFEQLSIAPPVEAKSERVLDVPGYKWFKENHPEAFAKIAEHVSVKPKKTSVTVKPAKK